MYFSPSSYSHLTSIIESATQWAREREALEHSIESLEVELSATRHASNELDEQKQENLLLKETIDRLRFDLDALRAGMTSHVQGQSQGHGSLSRSLANEFKQGFERREREEREREQEEQEAEAEVIVEDVEGSEDGYIETTITTSRKRVCPVLFKLWVKLIFVVKDRHSFKTCCSTPRGNAARICRR
jgi:hypothetical protein